MGRLDSEHCSCCVAGDNCRARKRAYGVDIMSGMELFIFARFHAGTGNAEALEAALREVVPPTRAEPGCLSINTFRSTRDSRVFYLHSRWADEAAFEHHATLAHTVKFIGTVTPLVDHEFDLTRARLME